MSNIVYNKDGIPFDIDALVTDVNGKADRDLLNLSTSLLHIEKLCEANIQRGDIITFDKSPLNYDFLIMLCSDTQIMIGRAFGDRIKINGLWGGVDSNSTSGYNQNYCFDCGDRNGNTYTVWNFAYTSTDNIQMNQLTHKPLLQIYGVKII